MSYYECDGSGFGSRLESLIMYHFHFLTMVTVWQLIAKRGIELRNLTRSVSRIRREIGNKSVIIGTERLYNRFPLPTQCAKQREATKKNDLNQKLLKV